MKSIAIFIAWWGCIIPLNAQKITEKHIDFSGRKFLDLDIQITDSINISTWKKNEVYVTASVNINENKDNDAYNVEFVEKGDCIAVKAGFRDEYFKGRKNNCVESEITWKVMIPEAVPFSVNTISGNVIITGITAAMDVKAISGFIDLAVQGNRNADLDFSTISGTVYTDLDLGDSANSKGISTSICRKLNSGGPEIKLETISGDVFFRKAR